MSVKLLVCFLLVSLCTRLANACLNPVDCYTKAYSLLNQDRKEIRNLNEKISMMVKKEASSLKEDFDLKLVEIEKKNASSLEQIKESYEAKIAILNARIEVLEKRNSNSKPVTITREIITSMGGFTISDNDLEKLNEAMILDNFDTKLEQAHFLAQLAQECAFKYYEELQFVETNVHREENFRKFREKMIQRGLDKHQPDYYTEGDERKFYGRGAIQITWKENYEQINKFFSGIDFLKNPEAISTPEYRFTTTTKWWVSNIRDHLQKNLSGRTEEDVDAITVGVNGRGMYGKLNRRAYFKKVLEALENINIAK